MKRTLTIGLKLGAAPFALSIAALSQPAFAQDTGETEQEATEATTEAETASAPGEIVVTGSRIRRDEYTTTEPITVVTSEEITQAGFNSVTDALQSGAVTGGSQQINNYYAGFVTDGGTGANTLGLRNLGPARTLVLLNGRRLAPAGTRGSLVAADLNVLPTAIVDRVEVLKAGASSIYGSDAVAGVVNIMTDTKVRGLHIEAQANLPEIGAGLDRRISATFGFDTDRLNVIGSVEYRKRDRISRNDQSWYDCPIAGYLTGEGTEFGSGDYIDPATGNPACFTLDNGGVTINTLGVPTRAGTPAANTAGTRFNRFRPNAAVVGGNTPGYEGVNYYTRDTFDPEQENEDLVTPVETYTGFLQANYQTDILGNAEVYSEFLGTRRKSSSGLYRQLSIDYLRGSPLLPEMFRNGIFLNPNNTSSGQFVAARAFVGYGMTDSKQKVDYVRASGGLRGDFFFPEWRYDAYVGKSWTDASYEIESFLVDRLATSLNVVQNADGSFSCAAQASIPNCVAAPALTADVIGGNLPQAWRDYIVENTIGTTKFRETTFALGFDGPLFTLPAGKVQLALGAEYRKQKIDDTPDDHSINGNLYGLTAGVPTRGSDAVKEVFGEIFVPILADKPLFHNLSLNGSVRYTDYDSYGSDVTYKVAGEWEFVRGFGVRASYGTSYRAPALAEQFLGATSGFASGDSDPCDADNRPDTSTPADRAIIANCAAIGIDATTFQQNNGVTVFTVGGAVNGLEAETSTNWSVGAVLQPRLSESFGDLSLSLDYFDIKVDNGVATLGSGTILNRCYEDSAFNGTDGFCRFVERDSSNRLTVTTGFVNLSTDIVKGFEFNGRYARDVAGGRLTLNASVTKYEEQSSRLFPEEYLADVNGTTTYPDWVGDFDATYRNGPVTVRYGLDWIGGSSGTYDNFAFDEKTGEVDEDLAQQYRDSYDFEVGDYFLHSASIQFDVASNFEMTLGVRNLMNKKPPRISADGFNLVGNAPLYSGYDYVGRSFFVNANFKM